jgi:hypothetical protein
MIDGTAFTRIIRQPSEGLVPTGTVEAIGITNSAHIDRPVRFVEHLDSHRRQEKARF